MEIPPTESVRKCVGSSESSHNSKDVSLVMELYFGLDKKGRDAEPRGKHSSSKRGGHLHPRSHRRPVLFPP